MGKTLKRQRAKLHSNSLPWTPSNTPNAIVSTPRPNVHDASKSIVKIDVYFKRKQWQKVLAELKVMLQAQKQPKLGTLQRWIRLADTTGEPPLTACLHYWILRVVGWTVDEGDPMHQDVPTSCLFRHPSWDAGVNPKVPVIPLNEKRLSFEGKKDRAYSVPTSDVFSGQVMAYLPNTLIFEDDWNHCDVQSVPFVPGAFVLRHVFTPQECQQFIDAAEALGFQGGVDYSFGFSADSSARMESRPAEGCFWLVDQSILDVVYNRVRSLLPQTVDDGRALAGINARWRFYRYDQGTIYRPHIDGSWPGSGITADGQYVFDAFGDRWSYYTILIYLNDDFLGGETTFYTPSCVEGCLNARGVKPRAGHVLVFPHGSLDAALHEGSAVHNGSKYVMRSDVLYFKE